MSRIAAMILAWSLAVAGSALAADVNSREARAVAEIKALGGRITVDTKRPGQPVIGVNFSRCFRLRDEGLEALRSLPNLRSLDLEYAMGVTDKGLEHFEGLVNLRSLNLEYALGITDKGMVHLKGLAHLRTLSLKCTRVSDAGLECLHGLKELRSLDLYFTKLSDAGLAHLKGLTKLESLDLTDTQVTDAGLRHLAGLTSLQSLDLGMTKVTDAGLAYLEGLKQLKSLDLSCHITDAGLTRLQRLTQLETLNLTETKVTDAGLEHLASLTKLRRVRLYFDKVSVEGIKKLQQALPNCKIESDYDKMPKPAELKVLGRLVGTWNTECTEKSGEREKRISGVMSVEWMLDGWFVRCKGMRKPEKITNEQIIGFSAKKGFQMWYFDSWGVAMAAAGQWNETSKTLTWRATPADNVVLVDEEHFIDDDTTEWHMVASNRDGAVLFEQRGKMTRQK